MKGIIETILEDGGIMNYRTASKSDDPTYHPGRCAEIILSDKSSVAVFGELHPLTAQNYGFDIPVYAAIIDTEKLASIVCFDRTYKQIPRYPAISRDFAFLCNADTEAGSIEEVISHAGGKLVEKIDLFDVFRGEKLGTGKKSLAFNVSLRSADHTLTDDEADKTAEKILHAVEKELGFKLREI